MLTSSRITAKSCVSTRFSASSPDAAVTISCPSSSSTSRSARSLSGRSSTIEDAGAVGSRGVPAAVARRRRLGRHRGQPCPQHADHQLGVDRLRQVVPRARLHALLAVALHRLRGHGDDRHVLARGHLADLADRVDAVHLRHHDVHQDHVDRRRRACSDADRRAPVVVRDDLHALVLEQRREREDVAHVVVDDHRAPARPAPRAPRAARAARCDAPRACAAAAGAARARSGRAAPRACDASRTTVRRPSARQPSRVASPPRSPYSTTGSASSTASSVEHGGRRSAVAHAHRGVPHDAVDRRARQQRARRRRRRARSATSTSSPPR